MNSQLLDFWTKVLILIESEVSPLGFSTWIKSITPLYAGDDKITLGVPDAITKNMVELRYLALISNAIAQLTGRKYTIAVTVSDPYAPAKEEKENSTFNSNSKYTFENFVVGNSNRFAHAACLAVAEAPAMAYNPLFLYGGVGLGKTHLMMAIGNYIKEHNPSAKVMYISSETFTNEMINSIKDKTNEEFRNKYRSIDVLLVDDIQFIAGKASTEEEFFHTFNTLHQANKQIVLTSDRPPKEIKTLEERLRSRFEWGLICDIQPPDFETKMAILRKRAQDENVQINDEVLRYIAQQIKSNIRELEGVFNRVIAYRGLVQREITLETAREAMKDYNQQTKHRVITADTIIEACAKYFGLKVEDIKSSKRTKELANARQIAMYLTREMTDASLNKIAAAFGNKDHSTVLYGIKKIEASLKTDPLSKKAVEEITEEIKN